MLLFLLEVMSVLGIVLVIIVSGSEDCSFAAECCPPRWQRWGDSCYRLTSEGATWADSRPACREMGGEMFAPRSLQENEFLVSMIPKSPDPQLLWVACNDIEVEGEWKCEGQEKDEAFFNWYPGEPNGAAQENCVAMLFLPSVSNDGNWTDTPCTDTYHAFCVIRLKQPRHYCFTFSDNRQLLNSCLVDHVIREFVTKSIIDCGSACTVEPRCRSFNMKQTSEEKQLCQLNNATSSDDPDNFKKTDSFCIYSDL